VLGEGLSGKQAFGQQAKMLIAAENDEKIATKRSDRCEFANDCGCVCDSSGTCVLDPIESSYSVSTFLYLKLF
jgi:hypothetical protein